MTDPGDLRELVTVQQKKSTGTGDRGQPTYTWVTFATVYANIQSMDGRKVVVGKQMDDVEEHMITMRFVSGLNAQMRVVDSAGTVYNIKNVSRGQDASRYFWHKLRCAVQWNGV